MSVYVYAYIRILSILLAPRRRQLFGVFPGFRYNFMQDVLAGVVLWGIVHSLFRHPDNIFVAGLVSEPLDAFGNSSSSTATVVFDDIA